MVSPLPSIIFVELLIMRTVLDRSAESFIAPEIGEPPLTLRRIFNASPLSFSPQISSWQTPGEVKEAGSAIQSEQYRNSSREDNFILRGRDQVEAISNHLDAVPLNRVIDGDLIVLNGRPGRREQWGIVTTGKDGELYVHHTDSRYWSKTKLSDLAESGRMREAYRAKTYKW